MNGIRCQSHKAKILVKLQLQLQKYRNWSRIFVVIFFPTQDLKIKDQKTSPEYLRHFVLGWIYETLYDLSFIGTLYLVISFGQKSTIKVPNDFFVTFVSKSAINKFKEVYGFVSGHCGTTLQGQVKGAPAELGQEMLSLIGQVWYERDY